MPTDTLERQKSGLRTATIQHSNSLTTKTAIAQLLQSITLTTTQRNKHKNQTTATHQGHHDDALCYVQVCLAGCGL